MAGDDTHRYAWARHLLAFNLMTTPQSMTSETPPLLSHIHTPSGNRRLSGYRRRRNNVKTWWFAHLTQNRFALLLTLPQVQKRHIFILLALGLKARSSRRMIQAQEIRALKKEIGETYYRFLRLRAPLLAPPQHDDDSSFTLDGLEESGRRFFYALDLPKAVRARLSRSPAGGAPVGGAPQDDKSQVHARAFIKRTLQQGESPWLWLSA